MKRFIAIFYIVLALALPLAIPQAPAAFGNVYYCFLWYDQSLSQGAYGYPLLTPFDPLPSTLRMLYSTFAASSPNQGSTSSEAGTTYTKLMPAYNSYFSSVGNSAAGESPTIAMAEAFDFLNGTLATPTAQPMQLALGVGGQAISALSSGTYYTNWENAVTGTIALLPSGASLNIPAIPFVQGEADCSAGTAQSTYVTAVETLESNMASEIKTLTSQSNSPIMLNTQETNCYGPFTGNTAYYNQITGGQLLAAYPSNGNNNIFNLGPLYRAENNNTQSGHITARSYFYLGEYAAKAFVRLFPGGPGTTIQPYAPAPQQIGAISNSANIVTVPIVGGVGAYQLDCSYVSSPNGACDGFYYTDNSGSSPSCSSVTISSGNLVMTLTSAPSHAVTAQVEYAEPAAGGGSIPGNQSGLRGCFHDSDTYTSLLDGRPLYNYLMAFDTSFTTN